MPASLYKVNHLTGALGYCHGSLKQSGVHICSEKKNPPAIQRTCTPKPLSPWGENLLVDERGVVYGAQVHTTSWGTAVKQHLSNHGRFDRLLLM